MTESNPAPEYDYELAITREGNPVIVTVRIPVTKDITPAQAVQRITGYNLRDEVSKRSAKELGIQNSGISAGPYRAIIEESEDGKTRTPIAYERDFKFTKTI